MYRRNTYGNNKKFRFASIFSLPSHIALHVLSLVSYHRGRLLVLFSSSTLGIHSSYIQHIIYICLFIYLLLYIEHRPDRFSHSLSYAVCCFLHNDWPPSQRFSLSFVVTNLSLSSENSQNASSVLFSPNP